MEQVGEVGTAAFFVDSPFYEQPDEIATNSSTFPQNSSFITSSNLEHEALETTSSVFDPCSEAISDIICINYPQLAIICVACFVVLLMVFLRVLCCCLNRRRKQKRVPDILAMEGDMIRHTRLNSISTVGHAPPRYSQIFDQDGISVFEEAPPDYETAQPDLLKSLPQNLSRTSSLASKGQPTEGEAATQTEGDFTKSKVDERVIKSQEALPTKLAPVSVISISVGNLLRDANQEVHC